MYIWGSPGLCRSGDFFVSSWSGGAGVPEFPVISELGDERGSAGAGGPEA